MDINDPTLDPSRMELVVGTIDTETLPLERRFKPEWSRYPGTTRIYPYPPDDNTRWATTQETIPKGSLGWRMAASYIHGCAYDLPKTWFVAGKEKDETGQW